ncbi:hypothetical protein N7540_013228 [Penicillium herquei]|nr:hypothetical protein N7540_013228 [Penicillium herquei]
MGVTPSRELATKILDLSNTASRDGKPGIEVDENVCQSGTCQQVIKARTAITIRERFIKVVMGKLIKRYKRQKDVADDAVSLLFPDKKQDSVKEWAFEGRKLESLCKGLYSSLCSEDATEDSDQHLGVLYVLPDGVSKETLRALPFKDGEARSKIIDALTKTLFASGIGEKQLKPYATIAVALFNRYQVDLDPGTINLSAQKHVFAQASSSLPFEAHSGSGYTERYILAPQTQDSQSNTENPQSRCPEIYERQSSTQTGTPQLHLTNQQYDDSSDGPATVNSESPTNSVTQSVRSISQFSTMPGFSQNNRTLLQDAQYDSGHQSVCPQGYAPMGNSHPFEHNTEVQSIGLTPPIPLNSHATYGYAPIANSHPFEHDAGVQSIGLTSTLPLNTQATYGYAPIANSHPFEHNDGLQSIGFTSTLPLNSHATYGYAPIANSHPFEHDAGVQSIGLTSTLPLNTQATYGYAPIANSHPFEHNDGLQSIGFTSTLPLNTSHLGYTP